MIDMQNQKDERNIDIDQVGVSGLRYPIIVLDKLTERQPTIASITMSVNLPHTSKGTHMSRFIEVLNKHRGEITMRTLPVILQQLRGGLGAESAHAEVRFPYFIKQSAPASGAMGLMDYECWFKGDLNSINGDFILGIDVPVTSLCPCSKAISDHGAHNQRGNITIEVRPTNDNEGIPTLIWLEELVEIAEKSASAPVYALLKRDDEKFVTEQAYDNPVFVEDMVRNVAAQLKEDSRVNWFRVHVVNHESIHNHGAFAQITENSKQ